MFNVELGSDCRIVHELQYIHTIKIFGLGSLNFWYLILKLGKIVNKYN